MLLQVPGPYAYLVKVPFNLETAQQPIAEGQVAIRLEVATAGKNHGGLAIYGKAFGKYPLDPTLLINMK